MSSRTKSRWIQLHPIDLFWTLLIMATLFAAFHLQEAWKLFSTSAGIDSPRAQRACQRTEEFFHQLEYQTYDYRYQIKNWLNPAPVSPDLMLLAIDDSAIERHGRWPWPRSFWVEIVTQLQALGAKAIYFDVDFPDASEPILVKTSSGKTLPELIKEEGKRLQGVLDPGGKTAKDIQAILASADIQALGQALAFLQEFGLDVFGKIDLALKETMQIADEELARALDAARHAGCATFGNCIFTALPKTEEQLKRHHVTATLVRAFRDREKDPIDAEVTRLLTKAELDVLEQKVELLRIQAVNYNIPQLQLVGRTGFPEKTVEEEYVRSRELIMRLTIRKVLDEIPQGAEASESDILDAVAKALNQKSVDDIRGSALQVLDQERSAWYFSHKSEIQVPGLERLKISANPSVSPPILTIGKSFEGMGSATAHYDSDGSIRRLPILWRYEGRSYPHVMLRLAAHTLGVDLESGIEVTPLGDARLHAKGHDLPIPIDDHGRAIMVWSGDFENDRIPKLNIGALLQYARSLRARELRLDQEGRTASTRGSVDQGGLSSIKELKLERTRLIGWIEEHPGEGPVSREAMLGTTAPAGAEMKPPQEWVAQVDQKIVAAEEEFEDHLRIHKYMLEQGLAKILLRLDPKMGDDVGHFVKRAADFRQAKGDEAKALAHELALLSAKIIPALEKFVDDATPEMLAGNADLQKAKTYLVEKYRPIRDQYNIIVAQPEELRTRLKAQIEGKVCMIGMVASGSTDFAPVPLQNYYPKVGALANLYNSIVTGNFISTPEQAWGRFLELPHPALYNLILWVLMAFIAVSFLPHMKIKKGGVAIVGLILLYMAVATLLLTYANTWIDFVGPTLTMLAAFVVNTIRRYLSEERLKLIYRKSFETLVDPKIVEVVLENQDILRKLGGANYEVTAFFSDVEGFTTISELLSPEELAQMLVDYLTPMTDIIVRDYQGTRDKYIGDAIVAFWGAPLPERDHATKGCLAALRQVEQLEQLKTKWEKEGKDWYVALRNTGKDINFRIGLNTGTVKVGVFGAENASNYTMIGDAVNLASRLEGANKEYGTRIMITEATYLKARDAIEVRELDRLRVKGKLEPVTIFEVLAPKGKLSENKVKVVEAFHNGLKLYRERRWEEAKAVFDSALAIDPEDGPCGVYRERVNDTEAAKHLGADWDGVYVMTTK